MPLDRLTAAHEGRTPRRDPQAEPSGSPDTAADARPSPVGKWQFWAAAYALLIRLTGTNLPAPQYAPAPYVLPFVVEIVLLVPAAAVIITLPATRSAARWQPRRPEIPAAMRTAFATSGAASFLAFAVIGLFLTLIPTYVATLSGSKNLLLGGAAVALMLGCSAIAQLVGYGRPARALELVGLPLLAAGLMLLALAGGLSSLALLLVATVVAGIGQGLAFLGGLTAVSQATPTGRHADVLSSFYVIIYLGVSLPAIGVGFLTTVVGLLAAVQYFAGVVALLCVTVLIVLVRVRHRTPTTASSALSDIAGD